MATFSIEATERSPRVLIDPPSGCIEFEGESYPENVVDFFGPVLRELRAFLRDAQSMGIEVNFKLNYFNSSSAKVIFNIIDMLDRAATMNQVHIRWYADEDDDVMLEFGEDLQEDVSSAQLEIVAVRA
jgi:hypothetical protein